MSQVQDDAGTGTVQVQCKVQVQDDARYRTWRGRRRWRRRWRLLLPCPARSTSGEVGGFKGYRRCRRPHGIPKSNAKSTSVSAVACRLSSCGWRLELRLELEAGAEAGAGGWGWKHELEAGTGGWNWRLEPKLEPGAGAGSWSWRLELEAGGWMLKTIGFVSFLVLPGPESLKNHWFLKVFGVVPLMRPL